MKHTERHKRALARNEAARAAGRNKRVMRPADMSSVNAEGVLPAKEAVYTAKPNRLVGGVNADGIIPANATAKAGI